MNHSQTEPWTVYYHSSERMPEVPDSSASAVIASPPFTNRSDGKTLDKKDYLAFIRRVFKEAFRVLGASGIFVTINTDLRDHSRYNHGRARFEGLLWQKHSDLRMVAEEIGFRCTTTKIWAKSFKRNSYRFTFAYIQFFQKPSMVGSVFSRKVQAAFGPDVWLLEHGTTRRDSHGNVFRDAIHPEIVRRCLDQFTLRGDLVISPFTGSGTILSVANSMGRRCIGYEVDRNLEELIRESIESPQRFRAYTFHS